MHETRKRLLIVDDEPAIRSSLALILSEFGYRAEVAEDGFSALAEIKKEIPDILLSDLNMPGMSGFELLSVVRKRFPAMQTIAMSGAFSGNEVPSGVAAHRFYQKSSSIGSLLMILESLPQSERVAPDPTPPLPVRIERSSHDTGGEPCVTINCPECLRAFSQAVGASLGPIQQAECIHCRNTIHYTIVEPADWVRAEHFQKDRAERTTKSDSAPHPA
jgi:CheY-like chemotaxis protein